MSFGASGPRLLRAVTAVAPLVLLTSSLGVAQPAPSSPSDRNGATASPSVAKGVVVVDTTGEMLLLRVEPFDDGSIGLLLSSHARRCRFPEKVFELPVQINDTGFQLKHTIRPEQKRDGHESCTEAIATVYQAEHYWPLKASTSVTLHLPWGPVPLPKVALDLLAAVTPTRPAEKLPADPDQYAAVIHHLNALLSAGHTEEARRRAEVLLPHFVLRPPHEGLRFFAALGMARRMTGDLSMAASSFEVAVMLGQMGRIDPDVAVVYDNLATVRRLQKRWADAEQASERAIAALEQAADPERQRSLGGAYNNRALILVEQEEYELALVYSEKALALLKVALQGQVGALEPFLEDNRQIRRKLRR